MVSLPSITHSLLHHLLSSLDALLSFLFRKEQTSKKQNPHRTNQDTVIQDQNSNIRAGQSNPIEGKIVSPLLVQQKHQASNLNKCTENPVCMQPYRPCTCSFSLCEQI